MKRIILASLLAVVVPWAGLSAQASAVITGRVLEAETGAPITAAAVRVEGLRPVVFSDSLGRYRLTRVPAGPHTVVVERLAYATSRVPVTVPAGGLVELDVELASTALRLEGITVTADAVGRARGELGTASVIDQDAIEVQSATSLKGILELVPGQELTPPGLGEVEQVSLRTAPLSIFGGGTTSGVTAQQLSSLGTLIVLDGVPVSNNANLQTLGRRGETSLATSAGGGVDLRRIPASTLERVEVIRGIPSARYGDLSQGVIVVDTRAGAYEPRLQARVDARTEGGAFLGGWSLDGSDALSVNGDVTGTETQPGFRDDRSYRFATQLSQRTQFGPAGAAVLILDSRVDVFQVVQDVPEDSAVAPGVWSRNRNSGLRASERARLNLSDETSLELTSALDFLKQRTAKQEPKSRGAIPFTDRVTEGRQEGRYIGGEYSSFFELNAEVWQLFNRLEAETRKDWLGADHDLRAGLVLRREWNSGDGYQFDIEFPPQARFNGVQGFDRPRSYDAIPAMATSALYVDERAVGTIFGGLDYDLQAGLRLDALHDGTHWLSGARDVSLQPRLNLQLAPVPWARLRGGWGRTAKQPTLGQLHPAPQYFDVINVNWFTPDPRERLAVLTTFVRDPSNPDLGLATGEKAELGVELASGGGGPSFSIVGFRDGITGGIGIRSRPGFILRDRFAMNDSTVGDGVPTEIVLPPVGHDSVPILVDLPANNLELESRGIEMTLRLPELRALRTRLEVQGAWIESEFFKRGLDFGVRFGDFQLDPRQARAPFWEAVKRTGERGIMTYRLVHHQPALGLVVTGTIQHFFKERVQNIAGTDTLAWEGYITRGGEIVRVPSEDRSLPVYEDLRQPRVNTFVDPQEVASDWFLSLQLSLALPLDGRLSFYAFNALDRPGKTGDIGTRSRFLPDLRFGLEGMLPLGWVRDALR